MVAYSFKSRFVEFIRAGLRLEIEDIRALDRPKRQTIRAVGKRRHARPGEVLQLYTGMRTRQCQKIGEARCTSVSKIKISGSKIELAIGEPGDWMEIRTRPSLDEFARADGFIGWADMHNFWCTEHDIRKRPFEGLLIKWEPING